VLEQVASLVEDMKKTAADESLRSLGANQEVQRPFRRLHFEQVAETERMRKMNARSQRAAGRARSIGKTHHGSPSTPRRETF